MRTGAIAATASLFLAFAAHAEGPINHVSDADAVCTTLAMGVHHVAYSLPEGPECCAQQLRCTQFLSTTTIERPRLEHRT